MSPENIRKKTSRHRYVDEQAGWRMLFFALAIGGLFGLSFKLYFSPARVKAAVSEALLNVRNVGVSFEGAELRLSNGSMPQFGVVIKGVKVAPAPTCRPEPSVSIAELTLPLRMTSLVTGKVALGVVSAADMIVDIDGVKVRCDKKVQAAPVAIVDEKKKAPEAVVSQEADEPLRFWKDDQFDLIRSVVLGVDFSRVELLYENKSKRIFLDSFSARLPRFSGPVEVSTQVVVPPEVSYGEKLPPFTIKAEAWPDRANVDIKAHMSEGHLVATGAFKPAPKQTLEMDARFDVRDVPLSEMVPLLVKSGIVPPEFKPKSLWFDCSARIAGPFQQILDHAPLNLENCRVKGDGAQIDVARATRHPSGIWDPFSITLTRVRISKILETLNAKPGDAVMTDFGRLSGMIELKSPDEAHFKGNLEGARIAFRRHNVRAEQTIQSMKASVDLEGDRFKGLLNDVVVENGEFVGRAELEFNRKVKDGSIHIDIQSLILDPAVQKTLVNGLLGSAKGNGDLRVQDGRLTEMKSELTINKTEGSELRFDKAEFKAKLAEAGSVMIDVESPVLEFSRTSPMATAMAPLFFEHQFQNDWISLHDVEFQAHAPPGGGIRWSHGRAKLENGQIGLSSEGAMSQERRLIGWVEMDYPSVKKLRFALSGTTNAPELSDNSPSLIDLRKRMRVDDLVLGLKIQ